MYVISSVISTASLYGLVAPQKSLNRRFFKAGPTRPEREGEGVTVKCRVRFARDPRGCVLLTFYFVWFFFYLRVNGNDRHRVEQLQ